MSFTAIARGWKAKVLAVMVAAATVFGMMQLANPNEADAHRGHLRPGCEWDQYNYWLQYCRVYSPAMDREIPVHIRPGTAPNSKALYLLDGLRARNDWSEWVWRGNAARLFEHDNVTLAMPVGGEASFYTDWQRPTINKHGQFQHLKWETFLTQELPNYLADHFQTQRTGNAIAGLSMGASAAMSLAYNHRDQFSHVSAFSGYLQTSNPVVSAAIGASQVEQAGYDPSAMWGPPGVPTPDAMRNDPMLNLHKMQGLGMFITSANGYPSHWSTPEGLAAAPSEIAGLSQGMVLEGLSRASTMVFEGQARAAGLNPVVHYSADGIHSWELWERDLTLARPHILAGLGLPA